MKRHIAANSSYPWAAGTIYDPTISDEERARLLGHDSVMAMQRRHDPLHCLLSGLFGKPSPTLRWVASGYREPVHPVPARHDDAVGWEEDLCLEVDRWLTTEQYGPTMRILWWMGIDEKKLRAALLERLEGNREERA